MPSPTHLFRQNYRPAGERAPQWLRRFWMWL